MNHAYFASLLCITIVAFAPACKTRRDKTFVEKVKTIVGGDEVGVETTTTTKKTIATL